MLRVSTQKSQPQNERSLHARVYTISVVRGYTNCRHPRVRRGLKSADGRELDAWLVARHEKDIFDRLLSYQYVIDIDNTVKPIFGHQEGAELGYNPQKPRRCILLRRIEGREAHSACDEAEATRSAEEELAHACAAGDRLKRSELITKTAPETTEAVCDSLSQTAIRVIQLPNLG